MLLKTKEFYLKHRLIINLFLIGSLFLMSIFFKQLTFVPFVLVALLCVFDTISQGLSYLTFALPYLTIRMPQSIILYVVAFAVVAIKMFIITLFIKKKKIAVWEWLVVGLVIVYFCLPFGEYNRNFFLKMFMLVGLLISLSVISKKAVEINFKQCIRVLGLSLIISACLALFKYILPGYTESFDKIHRFTAMFNNTNTFAITCEIALGFLMYVFVTDKKWYDALLIVFVALIGCLTFSKTYFIILVCLAIALFCCFIKSHTKQTLIVAAVGLVLVGIIWAIYPKGVNYLLSRFAGLDSKDFASFMNRLTTGRYTLWQDYTQYLFHNPLRLFFGCGLGAPRASFSSPHNIFIATLYQLGLVGVGLLIFAIVIILRHKAKNAIKSKFNHAIILPILVLILVGMVEDTIMFIAIL